MPKAARNPDAAELLPHGASKLAKMLYNQMMRGSAASAAPSLRFSRFSPGRAIRVEFG